MRVLHQRVENQTAGEGAGVLVGAEAFIARRKGRAVCLSAGARQQDEHRAFPSEAGSSFLTVTTTCYQEDLIFRTACSGGYFLLCFLA